MSNTLLTSLKKIQIQIHTERHPASDRHRCARAGYPCRGPRHPLPDPALRRRLYPPQRTNGTCLARGLQFAHDGAG